MYTETNYVESSNKSTYQTQQQILNQTISNQITSFTSQQIAENMKSDSLEKIYKIQDGNKLGPSTFYQGNIPKYQKFSLDDDSNDICEDHFELKEYILFENAGKFSAFSNLCKNCLSEINQSRNDGEEYKAKLFDSTILLHKDKIIKIRENAIDTKNIEIAGQSQFILMDSLYPLIVDLLKLCEEFESEINSKIGALNFSGEEIKKIKEFINNIPLTSNNEPNLKGIGRNKNLKTKYIKLALFLIKFKGIQQPENSLSCEYSEKLREYIKKIIIKKDELSKKISDWLKFLLGEFYDYIHEMENKKIDGEFRNEMISKISIVQSNQNNKIINQIEDYNYLIQTVSILEEENKRLKEEKEKSINNLKNSGSDISSLYISQIKILEEKLSTFLNENLNMRSEISRLKENESKLKEEVNRISIESDHLIQQFNINLNVAQNKLNGHDQDNMKFQIDVLVSEIEYLRNQLNNSKKCEINNVDHINSTDFHCQYELIKIENNQKVQIISNLEQEIDTYKNELIQMQKILNQFKLGGGQVSEYSHEKDIEIRRLQVCLSTSKDEWLKLSESYEALLADLKQQMAINEALRRIIVELQNKIDDHNENIEGLESVIRIQIEKLAKQTINKSKIDYISNDDVIDKSEGEIEILRKKLWRLESQQIFKSSVYTNNNGFIMEQNTLRNNSCQEVSSHLGNYEFNRSNFISQAINNDSVHIDFGKK